MSQVIYKKKVLNNEILVTFDKVENFYMMYLNGKCIGGEQSKYSLDDYNAFLSDVMRMVDTLLAHDNIEEILGQIERGEI